MTRRHGVDIEKQGVLGDQPIQYQGVMAVDLLHKSRKLDKNRWEGSAVQNCMGA